ncbi:probable ATP-dependent RNA helicase DDX4 [Xenia sp. Carnegie-2017]|uniref:probable ATP-dependent RNA helicase DDX4 n=1 Tax=Xenia sp. Carnegie-2017 TaxID=2897299 RepID=UPI001F03A119|nr:probable ATP-dependent RNA helicase DDX4 [Xenia sp. Carnegie-2017]XP_046850865.1 probable ATP-dependent RNA helicase DDX4 [Xenia sp. Carnegie-2017]
MACAQTGSGKTAAFILPVMTGMMNNGLTGSQMSMIQAPQAIVIAPTRELANQIFYEAYKFARGTMLKPCVCYGGVSAGHQLSKIEAGCHLLVATLTLMDFIGRRKISLEGLKYLILDEADRMLDMGFEPVIRELASNPNFPAKTERQTLMFSATFPEEIQRLAGEFLNDYLFLTVGRVGSATADIEQNICQVSEFEKRDKLVEILNDAGSDRILVFVETKRMADFLASYLSQTGFPTTSIHGDRQQREREEALYDFKKGRTPVMVATSVAARGLDIQDVKHVINYDLPKEIEEYVHRIGRTGRIGNKGKATSFFQSDKDANIARSLVKVLGDAEQDVPDWLEEQAESAIGTNYGPAGGRFGGRDTRRFDKGNSDGGHNDDFNINGGDDAWGINDSKNTGDVPSPYAEDNVSHLYCGSGKLPKTYFKFRSPMIHVVYRQSK